MEKKELDLFQFYSIIDNNYVPEIDIHKSADLFVKNEQYVEFRSKQGSERADTLKDHLNNLNSQGERQIN